MSKGRNKITRQERAVRNAAKAAKKLRERDELRERFARQEEARKAEEIAERAKRSGIEIATAGDVSKLAGTKDNMKGKES